MATTALSYRWCVVEPYSVRCKFRSQHSNINNNNAASSSHRFRCTQARIAAIASSQTFGAVTKLDDTKHARVKAKIATYVLGYSHMPAQPNSGHNEALTHRSQTTAAQLRLAVKATSGGRRVQTGYTTGGPARHATSGKCYVYKCGIMLDWNDTLPTNKGMCKSGLRKTIAKAVHAYVRCEDIFC